jgi:uncharacterized protein
MPVRSLRSFVLAWPGRHEVQQAVEDWALDLSRRMTDLAAVGLFGSYARGDWGVGSDVDPIVVVDKSESPFGCRTLPSGAGRLPVPADHLIYTLDELVAVLARGGRFADTLRTEVVWAFKREGVQGLPI